MESEIYYSIHGSDNDVFSLTLPFVSNITSAVSDILCTRLTHLPAAWLHAPLLQPTRYVVNIVGEHAYPECGFGRAFGLQDEVPTVRTTYV